MSENGEGYIFREVYRYFSEKDFNTDIKTRKPSEDSPEDKALKKLIVRQNYLDLEDEDFENTMLTILKGTKQGKYPLQDYVTLIDWFYFFKENQLLDISTQEIDEIIQNGITIAAKRNDISAEAMTNLKHLGKKRKEAKEVLKQIEEIHKEIRAEEYREISEEFLEALRTEDHKKLKTMFLTYNYTISIFQYFDKQNLLKTILLIKNWMLNLFIDQIEERYSPGNVSNYHAEDYETLKYLNDKIEKHLQENNFNKVKRLHLRKLNSVLIQACNKLNAQENECSI